MSAEHSLIPASSTNRPENDRSPPGVGDSVAGTFERTLNRSRVRPWPIIVAGGVATCALLWLATGPRNSEFRPVLDGRRFSHSERRQAEHALRDSGIRFARADGNRLHVAPEELPAADAVVAQADHRPVAQTGQWQAASSLLDQFATGRRQEEAASAARAAQVARLLEQQPGVSSAEIVWDEESRIGRRQSPRVRATVFLKPEPGCAIGLDTVHAVRMAVAGSRAHLTPADVVVMDLQRQVTYDAPRDPQTFAREAQRAELTGKFRAHIESSLADFPGARVDVQVRDVPASTSLPYAAADRSAGAPTRKLPPPADDSRTPNRSGPNLRLEVPRTPVEPQSAFWPKSPGLATRHVDPTMQLDVTINLPAGYVTARLTDSGSATRPPFNPGRGRDAVRHEIRTDVQNRVATALIDTLPTDAAVNVSVRIDPLTAQSQQTDASPQRSVSAASSWQGLGSLTADFSTMTAVASLTALAAILMFVLRRLSRRTQRPSDSSAATYSLMDAGAYSPQCDRLTAPPVAPLRRAVQPPVPFLPGIEAEEWTTFAAREPVAVIAGLLRVLSPEEVALLIGQLSAEQQREVLARTPSAAISDHEVELLRRRLRTQLQASPRSALQPASTKSLAAERIADRFPASAGTLLSQDLEALSHIDDESLARLVERIPKETWTAALVAAPPRLQKRISRISGHRDQAIASPDRRPLRLRDIESAQQRILDEWRSLPTHRTADDHR